jgi:protein-S-isoprenylcysteine O-methyltransferase Ste14
MKSCQHLVMILMLSNGVFQYVGLCLLPWGLLLIFGVQAVLYFMPRERRYLSTPTKELVVTGLYKFVRNPLYIAGTLVLAGETLLFQSIGIFIYTLIMFGVFHVHVLIEETHLENTFGKKYEQYRRSVPRWIPRFKSYRGNESKS